eukprot:TRINITY_DN1037_c0_g1_i1.p1 TRINITY_DN1037_c0_g1~~TRINITY_DN1037_c0_g1_i1.p1  ORF type:complete len:153 (+),score=24.20 TRINITY_DN1037_c0_g1_i1:486-944(+)
MKPRKNGTSAKLFFRKGKKKAFNPGLFDNNEEKFIKDAVMKKEFPEIPESFSETFLKEIPWQSFSNFQENISLDCIEIKFSELKKEKKTFNEKLSKRHCIVIASLLEGNTSIEELEFSENKIDDDCAEILLKSLKKNKTLRKLTLKTTKSEI